jgi:hypothetical protein
MHLILDGELTPTLLPSSIRRTDEQGWNHMKRFLASIIFLLIYIGGVTVAWNLPGTEFGGTIPFAFLWLFLTSKLVSHLVAWFGWTERKAR